jgi:hypothetical protein
MIWRIVGFQWAGSIGFRWAFDAVVVLKQRESEQNEMQAVRLELGIT